jgi:hypothetical protein
MLLAPTLTAITERGREILDGLYPPARDTGSRSAELPSLKRTVIWARHPAVLRQLHLEPLVAAASAVGAVVIFRQTAGATLLPGLPVADVHGGDPGQDAVLRAVVTGPERRKASSACSPPGPAAPTSSSTMPAPSGSSSVCRDGRTSPAAALTT